jgi:hypothetical protein
LAIAVFAQCPCRKSKFNSPLPEPPCYALLLIFIFLWIFNSRLNISGVTSRVSRFLESRRSPTSKLRLLPSRTMLAPDTQCLLLRPRFFLAESSSLGPHSNTPLSPIPSMSSLLPHFSTLVLFSLCVDSLDSFWLTLNPRRGVSISGVLSKSGGLQISSLNNSSKTLWVFLVDCEFLRWAENNGG